MSTRSRFSLKASALKAFSLIIIVSILSASVPRPVQAAPASPTAPVASGEVVAAREAVTANAPLTLGAAWAWLEDAAAAAWRRVAGMAGGASRALTFDSPLPTPEAEAEAVLTAPAPALLLSVQGGEEAVKPGDTVELRVMLTNAGSEPARDVAIEAALPEGLHTADGRAGKLAGWEYDRQAGQLRAQVEELAPGAQVTLTLKLKARGPLDTLAEVAFEACSGSEAADTAAVAVTAIATVWVAHPKQATINPGGGQVESEDGRVRVDFPPGALKETREITVRAAHRNVPVTADRPGRAMRFSFNPDMAFEEPVTATVDLQGLVSLKDLPAGWRPYLIYLEDPAQGQWEYVPLKHIDWEASTITAELVHFSDFEVGVVSENGWHLLFKDAAVDGFRGSASYVYPLNVPAGRGGLQPDLLLSYNSDAINGILNEIQSDWVGLGWSLDVPQITRHVGWCPWGDPQNGHVQLCTDARYTLIIGGTGYALIPDGSGGRYRTDKETFYWVQQRQGAANQLGTDWIVKTTDGTTYYFGSTTDSEQVLCDVAYMPNGQMTYRWRLNKVVDTHGNEMVFQYDEEQNDSYHCQRASYLSHIWYNKRTDGSAWGTHIVLARSTRLDDPDGVDHTGYLFFQREHLDRVQVWWESQLVREYKLQYDFHGESRRLQQVIEYGKGGIAGGATLPATTFGYQVLDNTRADWGDGKTYPYSRLVSIDNGYGGRIEIDYQQTVVNDLHGYHYRVLKRRTKDGMGHTAERVYNYGPACMDATDSKCDDGHRGWGLKGYEWCTEEVRDYDGAVLNKQTDMFVLPWPLTGRVGAHEVSDSAGNPQQRTETEWDYYWIVYPPDGYKDKGAAFYHVDTATTIDYTGGNNFVWVEDALPAGATPYTYNDSWTWVTIDPVPYSGSTAHRSIVASGVHQHYFDGASAVMSVAPGDKLYTYVYLDPDNMPREIVLQWDDGNWEHRAYWGENLIGWGIDGTNSRRYMGPLPEGGRWVRLEVEANKVGLEGQTVDGVTGHTL